MKLDEATGGNTKTSADQYSAPRRASESSWVQLYSIHNRKEAFKGIYHMIDKDCVAFLYVEILQQLARDRTLLTKSLTFKYLNVSTTTSLVLCLDKKEPAGDALIFHYKIYFWYCTNSVREVFGQSAMTIAKSHTFCYWA